MEKTVLLQVVESDGNLEVAVNSEGISLFTMLGVLEQVKHNLLTKNHEMEDKGMQSLNHKYDA